MSVLSSRVRGTWKQEVMEPEDFGTMFLFHPAPRNLPRAYLLCCWVSCLSRIAPPPTSSINCLWVCQYGARSFPIPSPISLTSLGFPHSPLLMSPCSSPKAHDEHRSAVLNDDDAESEMGHRKSRQVSEPQPGDSPTACGDYTKMAFSLNSGSTLNSTSPKASLPDQPESVVPALGLGLGLDFPLAKSQTQITG